MSTWVESLPDLTSVGWQTVTAVDGGGGRVVCRSTSAPIVRVVELLTADLGPPTAVAPTTTAWRTVTVVGGAKSIATTRVWLVGQGSAPGYDARLVPPGALCIVEESMMYVPERDPGH